MKNAKKNTIVVLLIMIVVFCFVLKDDYANILNNLLLANKWFILIAIILVVCYWFFKSICLYVIVKEYKPKIKLFKMFQQILITQFFNGITPFSTGGQPMQVYMLRKSGLKVASATNIIVQEFIMYQLALIVIGALSLILNWKFQILSVSPVLKWLIILGFIINILVGLGLIFISFSKKFNDFVGKLIIKIGAKIKLVKDMEKTLLKWEEKLAEYNDCAKLFKKNKFLFVKCFLYNFLALFLFYLVPFFIFKSFNFYIDITILEVLICSSFVLLIGNFVPIPGGSGGIEFGFLQFFSSYVPNSVVASALIIWRFVTYYLGIFVGGIALSFFKGDDKEA